VDFFSDIITQIRDETKVAPNLTKAYSKYVQIHGQNSLIQSLYLTPSEDANKHTDSVFYDALSGLIVDGIIQKVNFSDTKSLKVLDDELHSKLKDEERYRFAGHSDRSGAIDTWTKVNSQIMKWFDIIEAEITEGGEPAEVEARVRKTVGKLTQLSCTLNSPELMDKMIEEIHSGDKEWEKYVTAFEQYMHEKCASSEALDEFWNKKDEQNSKNAAGMATLMALCSFVGVITVGIAVYLSLKMFAQRYSPASLQMVKFQTESVLKYHKVGTNVVSDKPVVSKGENTKSYGSTTDDV